LSPWITFIKLHAVEENDNGAMDYVCDLLTKIAIDGNIAVDAPHHTKKGQQTAGDADAGRGASSARDAGRLLYTLTRMSEEEAKAFGIPAEQRALYIRLDSSKVNIAPPPSEATWFKLVGVQIGNGTDDYPNGDDVQTVVPWHPPRPGTASAVHSSTLPWMRLRTAYRTASASPTQARPRRAPRGPSYSVTHQTAQRRNAARS